jgi:hypothetical protein
MFAILISRVHSIVGFDHIRNLLVLSVPKCDLDHSGKRLSKLCNDGKCKRKQQLRGTLKETFDHISSAKNDVPSPNDIIKAAANISGLSVT